MEKMMASWKQILPILMITIMITGCGTDAFNVELSRIHKGGANCAQSSCHAGFTISGTLFELIDSKLAVPDELLRVIPPEGLEYALRADSLGNFWEEGRRHEGDFLFGVGTKSRTSGRHPMPEWRECNTCHDARPAGSGGTPPAVGRIF